LLRSLHATAVSTTDYAAAALAYPVWNVIDREVEVLLKWTFRESEVTGVVLLIHDDRRQTIAFHRDFGMTEVLPGLPHGEKDDIVELREITFEGRRVASLELRFSPRDVRNRIRVEALFIVLVVLALDSVLGLALLLILRSTVFRPLERIKRWASSLEQGEAETLIPAGTSERGEIASLRASIERMVAMILSKEREYRSLFDNSPVSIWELDFSAIRAVLEPGRQRYEDLDKVPAVQNPEETKRAIGLIRVRGVNSVTLNWLGVSSLKEIQGGISSLLDEDGLRIFAAEFRALMLCASGAGGECKINLPSGAARNYMIRFATLAGYEEDWTRVMLTAADITDRVQMENRLLAALQQKDILLRELFHRTRNSFQLISSMIALRESSAVSERRPILRSIRARINTISLAQDKLYESDDLTFLDLGSYIKDLVTMLVYENESNLGQVISAVEVASIPGSIDYAVPLGLFLCELVTNAFDHGFVDGRKGTLTVSFHKASDGRLELSVHDDGVGVPADFNPRRDAGVGLDTILALGERQLRGKIEFDISSGFFCVLCFSLPEEKPRV